MNPYCLLNNLIEVNRGVELGKKLAAEILPESQPNTCYCTLQNIL